ncbi:hypothetical protein [Heliomarina baculiformis]|uniref:hypothetical protein n=1 Tax=Heliomarina baculiformis TaxID=2872036 RepID=UPI001EE2A2E6|nr:hypothetical protein [Heliomarina baculiformis]
MKTAIHLIRDIPVRRFIDRFLAERRHRQQQRLEESLRRDLPPHILRDIGLSNEAPVAGIRR